MNRAFFFSRRSLALTCLFALLISVMAFGSVAIADDYTVNSSADLPDLTNGTGTCDAQETTGEQCTLRAAIQTANVNPGPDAISVSTSVDLIQLIIPGGNDAAEGDLDIRDDDDVSELTIDGNGVVVEQTVIDHRVFEIDTPADIREMTITGGDDDADGGGILNDTPLVLTDVIVSDNEAERGGGIFNQDEGHITATGLSLFDNTAPFGGDGGGIANLGDVTLIDSQIGAEGFGNSAGLGGGVMNFARMTIDNSSIVDNDAEVGGGIFNGKEQEENDCAHGESVNADCWLELNETEIVGNTSSGGGGIANGFHPNANPPYEGTTITGTGVEVTGNESDFEGGGYSGIITTTATADGTADVTFIDSDFRGNIAEMDGGGFWQQGGDTVFTNTDFSANQALGDGESEGNGGGLYFDTRPAEDFWPTVTITAGAVNENLALSGDGGGLWAHDGNVEISGTQFDGNEADDGGAIHNQITSCLCLPREVRASQIEISNNIAHGDSEEGPDGDGGGIWNNGPLFLENSTVSSNEAEDEGGGIWNGCSRGCGEVSSTANTIYENQALGDEGEVGGNVHDESITTVHYRMTIVANGFPVNCNLFGGHLDEGYNLDDDGTCFGDDNYTETATIIDQDPQLEDLDENGGLTRTHALSEDSPAVDAVGSEACDPPDFDQRGELRPADAEGEDEVALCDIGSFELQEDDGSSGGGGSSREPDCEDGIDNDDDDKVDEDDPGCSGDNDETEDSEGTSTPGPSPSPSPSPTRPGGGNGGEEPNETTDCVEAAELLGRNLVSGTNDDDVLRGTSGADVICAKDGDDEIHGLGGNDIIWAGAGNDDIFGGGGADIVRGGFGKDEAQGNVGGDEMTLGRGHDIGRGGAGSDQIYGRENRDQLFGGAGNDGLHGGPGRDICTGGGGTDTQSSC